MSDIFQKNSHSMEKDLYFICSTNGATYIRELIRKEYPDIADSIVISVRPIKKPFQPIPQPNPKPPFATTNIPGELLRRSGELTQNWVKRFLTHIFKFGLISVTEVERLHNIEYCKRTFGIKYSLLIDNGMDIYDNTGHARYWITWKLQGRYYVCSQWWKENDREYEFLINNWLEMIFS